MKEFIQAFFLSLLQGLTEFLPVSSSAHLILLPQLAGWQDQGIAFDIAVHAGTLVALIIYFKAELLMMAKDFTVALTGHRATENSRLVIAIIIATIPVALAGLTCKKLIESHLRSTNIIAIATICFGLLLGLSGYVQQRSTKLKTITWQHALAIGLAQVLALIPGASRSGVTLTAGLFLGLRLDVATRFSFLLAVPVITLASLLQLYQLITAISSVNWLLLAFSFIVAATSGLLCIHIFLCILKRFGLMPFVLYRLFLGLWLLYW